MGFPRRGRGTRSRRLRASQSRGATHLHERQPPRLPLLHSTVAARTVRAGRGAGRRTLRTRATAFLQRTWRACFRAGMGAPSSLLLRARRGRTGAHRSRPAGRCTTRRPCRGGRFRTSLVSRRPPPHHAPSADPQLRSWAVERQELIRRRGPPGLAPSRSSGSRDRTSRRVTLTVSNSANSSRVRSAREATSIDTRSRLRRALASPRDRRTWYRSWCRSERSGST